MKFKSVLSLIVVIVFCGVRQTRSQVDPSVKASDDIAVVVNPKNIYDGLTSEELRKILLGERRFWKGNVQVSLVLRRNGTRERDNVLALLLKMTNADFERHWQAKVFRGEASDVPLAVPSNGLAEEYVVDTPGAISFIVGKNCRPEVKVLKIDGKLPGAPGYLLK